MANRHVAQRKSGGRTVYQGAGSNVIKEAKARKKGGAVTRATGGSVEGGATPARATGGRLDKRARGGALKRAHGGAADKSPYSSACISK